MALDPRVYLRQGRFADARRLIEEHLGAERLAPARARAPRSHREASAVLAWIELLVGDAPSARQHAAEALEVGHMLGSPVIECLSLGRLGLSWLAGQDYDIARARGYCDHALRTADRFGVRRFRVEPLMGLTIIAGLERKPEDAERAAREALSILRDAGDRYVTGVVTLALGAALTLCGASNAETLLVEADRDANACGDQFVRALAALWLSVLHARAERSTRAAEALERARELATKYDYEFIFLGTALLAPKDTTLWRTKPTTSVNAAPLFIQALGSFRAWRAGQEIERAAWPREKALHLFQLLVAQRGHSLHRDKIIETLWPGGSPSTAATGLRVALSALRNALEPDRQSGTDGQFVRRDGDAIRLAMDAGIRVDVDEFSRMLKAARSAEGGDREQLIAAYEAALGLYRGDFLEENPYAAWAEEERQRRRSEFLNGAERFAALLLKLGDPERATRWAETMLEQDPLWEAAYGILMEAHWVQGNRALAVRAYNRCKKRLREGLGVAPSARITSLLEKISRPT